MRKSKRNGRCTYDHKGRSRSSYDKSEKGWCAGMSSETKKIKEPFVRIIKRDGASIGNKVLIRALAIVLALVVDAIFIFAVTGLNPISVYGVMFNGTFMTSIRFSWALRDLVTLLCIGIALAPAFKMKFWNIGAEGQVLAGGLATALVMVKCGQSLPTPALLLVMFLASIIAGGIWGLIPAVFKAYWNTNETLFTLMMNYVATSIVACMTNIMRGKASSLGKLNMSTQAGWFPQFFGQRYNINILVVFILMIVMYFYLKYSKQGYEITVVGESENTARYAGINVKPGNDPYHADIRCDLRTCRFPGCGRKRSDHFHILCRRTGIYCYYCCMAGQV